MMAIGPLIMLFTAILSLVSAAPPRRHEQGGRGNCRLHVNDLVDVADKYLHIWSTGNFSTVDTTMSPNVTYYQDRFPTGTGNGSVVLPVTTSQQYIDFVKLSRDGFKEYVFNKVYTVAQCDRIAIRWNLYGVANSTGATALIPADTIVSYNGTDTLTINQCSKLVDEVDSAQDFINFYHQLHIPLGTV